ncbi:MAG: ferredoxin [Frankiales bacterium]|nr:ferredoxin [Frankiales bacterium]
MTASQPAANRRPATGASAMLAVDWTRCDGHGLCAALLPGAIQVDEWGYPILDQSELATRPRSELTRAVSACPALALRRA